MSIENNPTGWRDCSVAIVGIVWPDELVYQNNNVFIYYTTEGRL